jgi:acyl carrier protein
MDRGKIKEEIILVFRDVFKDRNHFSEATSVDNIEEWDSLNHMILISNLEKKFNIQFDLFKLIELRNLGDFIQYINSEITNGN